MKAVLSHRVYLESDAKLQNFIDKELTYSIPSYNSEAPPQVIKNMAIIRPGLISIPIGRQDLIPDNYEIVDKRVLAPVEFPEFRGVLRASQQEIYDEVDDNCVINAKVSWGKTFAGLAIAGKLGQKTLVVVDKIPLRNQWVKEVEKVFGAEAGVIGSGKFDLDKSIIIGNTQTLSRRIPEISRAFGTVVMDEVHHISANTFSTVVDKNYARYKIGLSGTLIRKDGKHVVLRDYFGQKVFVPPAENFMKPEVHIIQLDNRFPDGSHVPWAIRVNDLCNDEDYRNKVALIAAKYAAEGHNVLVVADRVHFINMVAKLIGPNAVAITGKVAHEERDALMLQVGNGTINVLCGVKSMFSEGISHNPLSCLLPATPINNDPLLEQLIGRIVREYPGKKQPVVIDLHLKGNTAFRQANVRMGHYMKQDYVIRKIDARTW